MIRRLGRPLATAGLLLAVFVVALDGTVTATALPRIAAELRGLGYYVWVTTGYLVTSTVVQPIAGKLSDIFGRRSVVVVGLAGFTLLSVLVGASQTMVELVMLRALQGVFGGVLFAVPFAGVADLYAHEQRVRVQGVFAGVGGVAAIVGPLLGGVVTDHLGWRWIFYLNVPIGIASMTLVLPFLGKPERSGSWRDLDLIGGAALVAGVVTLLVGLAVGGSDGWTTTTLAMLVLGVALLVAFFAFERRVRHPLVPPALFASRLFSLAIVIAVFSGIGLYGVTFFLALLYQAVLGVSATGSGTLLLPMMLTMAVASPLSGQLLVRVPHYRFVATAGLVAMAGAAILLSLTTPSTPAGEVGAEIALLGAGMGLTWPISTAVIQAAMPMEVMGTATTQVNFWRSLGGTAGAVALGAIFANRISGVVGGRIASIHVSPQVAAALAGSGGQNLAAFLDPARLGMARNSLPPALQPELDHAVALVRLGFADVLSELFVLTALLMLVPIVASIFLPEVALGRRRRASIEPSAPPQAAD